MSVNRVEVKFSIIERSHDGYCSCVEEEEDLIVEKHGPYKIVVDVDVDKEITKDLVESYIMEEEYCKFEDDTRFSDHYCMGSGWCHQNFVWEECEVTDVSFEVVATVK